MILKSNHLNKCYLKSKSFCKWWFENHIKNQIILKYSLQSSYFDVFCLLTVLAIIYQMKHLHIYLINIATMDRKDQKGMYTNTFVHFLLAYNLVKQGLRTINI